MLPSLVSGSGFATLLPVQWQDIHSLNMVPNIPLDKYWDVHSCNNVNRWARDRFTPLNTRVAGSIPTRTVRTLHLILFHNALIKLNTFVLDLKYFALKKIKEVRIAKINANTESVLKMPNDVADRFVETLVVFFISKNNVFIFNYGQVKLSKCNVTCN